MVIKPIFPPRLYQWARLTFPVYRQLDSVDCGPTCLRIIAKYYGYNYPTNYLRKLCDVGYGGASLLGMLKTAKEIGFKATPVRIDVNTLSQSKLLPCILHWNQNHFVVLYHISKTRVKIVDPAIGRSVLSYQEFHEKWTGSSESGTSGIALILQPNFSNLKSSEQQEEKTGNVPHLLAHYSLTHRRSLLLILTLMFISSVFQLSIPFLTQTIVDQGINFNNIDLINLIIIGQLALISGQVIADTLNSWLLYKLGAWTGVQIISSFLVKLMRLPMSFFSIRSIGDILRRVDDTDRVEDMLTKDAPWTIVSTAYLVFFSIILYIYSQTVFVFYLIGLIIYIFWIALFLERRRAIDYERFTQEAAKQSILVQIISGVSEIKLNSGQTAFYKKWNEAQNKFITAMLRSLRINNFQQGGARLINEVRNIGITYIVVRQVVDNDLTIGAMVAIQYIIGQLNVPINNLVYFFRSAQDANLSLARLSAIQVLDEEQPSDRELCRHIVESGSIELCDVAFKYLGSNTWTLSDLTLTIPGGKVTAIVGASGSGKTTLMKLLLKFYEASAGTISIDGGRLDDFDHEQWRKKCGAVMQDGFIFSDSIARNVVVADEPIDDDRLYQAAQIANIHEFIESLPHKYQTIIGEEGLGLSQGQKQRILIARAIYKQPSYLFFDEATNALDASNERTIVQRLGTFFRGRTVVIIAHRLSTVRDADQIVVLDKGRIAEYGTHQQLIDRKGAYYTLIKDQLELGE